MNTEVPIAFEKIQDLKAKGQVQEANKIIDVIENKANHFMRNKLVRTGIDAAVSGLRWKSTLYPLYKKMRCAKLLLPYQW